MITGMPPELPNLQVSQKSQYTLSWGAFPHEIYTADAFTKQSYHITYFRAINYDYDNFDFAQVCLYTHICICIYAYMDECQHKNSGQNIQTSPAMSMPENIENIQNSILI